MKKMTKMGMYLLLCFMTFALFSCSQSLDEDVQSMKKDLPKDCGGGMKIINIENKADFLEMTMSMNEDEVRMDNPLMETMLQAMAGQMKEEFLKSDDIKPLMSKCKEENKGFKVIMEGETSKASVTFLEIPLEELQKQQDL